MGYMITTQTANSKQKAMRSVENTQRDSIVLFTLDILHYFTLD